MESFATYRLERRRLPGHSRLVALPQGHESRREALGRMRRQPRRLVPTRIGGREHVGENRSAMRLDGRLDVRDHASGRTHSGRSLGRLATDGAEGHGCRRPRGEKVFAAAGGRSRGRPCRLRVLCRSFLDHGRRHGATEWIPRRWLRSTTTTKRQHQSQAMITACLESVREVGGN